MADSSTQSFLARSMGSFGGLRINGDGHATGTFCGIHALTDTTIKAGTACNIGGASDGTDSLVGAVITQGDTVVGQFTEIHASGDAIFYFG